MKIGLISNLSFKIKTGVERYSLELINEFKKQKNNEVRIIKKFNDSYDLIHILVPNRFFFGKPKGKLIVTIHDLIPLVNHRFSTIKRFILFRFFLKHLLKKADRIIAVSESAKKDIVDFFGISPGKIDVVYLGIGEKIKRCVLPRKQILFIGTLEKRKNVINLIKAFHILKQKGLKEKLVIAGKKWDAFSEIANYIKDNSLQEDITILDSVADDKLSELYSSAKLFVFPSFYEGFGLPVLEAMSCGAPVIAANNSSLSEFAGDAGILINAIDINELANAMDKVLKDKKLQNKMRKKGFIVAKKFTWRKTAEETMKTYKKAMKR